MFQYADNETRSLLLGHLNEIVSTGTIPESWYNTHFGLLHKGGAADNPNNWRPIANLQITYRILARLVYNRIRVGLDIHQSEDQFGFRRKRSCVHALMVMESMISKRIEFNIPVWIISIDLYSNHRKIMGNIELDLVIKEIQWFQIYLHFKRQDLTVIKLRRRSDERVVRRKTELR